MRREREEAYQILRIVVTEQYPTTPGYVSIRDRDATPRDLLTALGLSEADVRAWERHLTYAVTETDFGGDGNPEVAAARDRIRAVLDRIEKNAEL
jgi:hypothetical protein